MSIEWTQRPRNKSDLLRFDYWILLKSILSLRSQEVLRSTTTPRISSTPQDPRQETEVPHQPNNTASVMPSEPMTPESSAEIINEPAARISAALPVAETSDPESSHIPQTRPLDVNSSNGQVGQKVHALSPVNNSLKRDLSHMPKDQAPTCGPGSSSKPPTCQQTSQVIAPLHTLPRITVPPNRQPSKALSSSAVRSHVSSPATSISSGKSWASEMSLTLQISDGSFDLETDVSGDYLRHLDLSAFFAFFSQRSGVPLAELQTLILKMRFEGGPRQNQVIDKTSGEEEWRKVKSRIRRFFEFVRGENPSANGFYIWIEFGKEVPCGSNNE